MVVCQFCAASGPPYVCPRCSAPYCSLSCYRCTKHASCSEQFYQECVKEEMTLRKSDPAEKRKTQEALARERQAAAKDTQLENRLASVDLNDPTEVLEALTAEQRVTFERLLESNEISQYIGVWQPWWEESVKLVQEVRPDNDEDELAGFRRQRKEIRPKIGGRKVKNLKPLPHMERSDKCDDSLKEQRDDKRTRGYTTDGRTLVDKTVQEVNEADEKTTNDSTQTIANGHETSVKTVVLGDSLKHQRDVKTRITDRRYHKKNTADQETNTDRQVVFNCDNRARDTTEPCEHPSAKVDHAVEDAVDLPTIAGMAKNNVGEQTGLSTTFAHKMEPSSGSHDVGYQSSVGCSTRPRQDDTNTQLLLDSLVGSVSDKTATKEPDWESKDRALAANTVNLLAAFAFVARCFNGDAAGEEVEAVEMLQSICATFKGQVFHQAEVALVDVICQDLVVSYGWGHQLAQDVCLILGSLEYTQRALFEIRMLFKVARQSLKIKLSLSAKNDSTSCTPSSDLDVVSLKDLKLRMLKTDFFFDWATKHFQQLQERILPIVTLEKEKLIIDRVSSRGSSGSEKSKVNELVSPGQLS